MRRLGALCFGILISLPAAYADLVPVGYISFDLVSPASTGSPGVNGFTIGNFTGDPTLGGFALPPDFPVLTNLTFLSSSLTLYTGTTSQVLNVGDIGPGFFSSMEFPDTAVFTAAMLTGNLSTTTLDIAGSATAFQADSGTVTLDLLPSSGQNLVAGTDFAVIEISGSFTNPPSVPEPSAASMLLVLAFAVGPFVKERLQN